MKKLVLKNGITFDINQALANEIKEMLIDGIGVIKSIALTGNENVEVFVDLKSVAAIY